MSIHEDNSVICMVSLEGDENEFPDMTFYSPLMCMVIYISANVPQIIVMHIYIYSVLTGIKE